MEIKKIEKLTIELEGDNAKSFSSALNKIAKGETKIGFSKQSLTDDECKVIKDLNNKLQ